MKTVATHVMVELRGLDLELLSDPLALEVALRAGADRAGCTVLGVLKKRFEPHGASVVLLLSESHVSIHTWPELDYAAVDLFTCGETLPGVGVAEIVRRLAPRHHEVMVQARGPVLDARPSRAIAQVTVTVSP